MRRPISVVFFFSILITLTGCAISPTYVPDPLPLEPDHLPPPNVELNLAHLGPCNDSPDRSLHLNTAYPVTVLVHGYNSAPGRFRPLAQLYAFHGQQVVCFSYDSRESLMRSSGQLISALDELSNSVRGHDLTVIGHSIGGLVARKALESDRRSEWRGNEARINLVTIAAPLGGIQAASLCGSSMLQRLSLGVVPKICRSVIGNDWFEITSTSDFIRNPGPLLSSVQRYLKVVTDERDTCRRTNANGACLESDYVISLREQYHPVIDNYPKLVNVEVKAGHVEIVGSKEVAPRKLLAILQQQGLFAPTPPERRAALEQLFAELYRK
ncbi:MAG TPA: alpha/beta hydrolase [Gallionella sp.]|nr:alpha/beta hydrolase [Gallionella sp.]